MFDKALQMPLRKFSRPSAFTCTIFKRQCSKMQKWRENFEYPDPFRRTCRIVKNDFKQLGGKFQRFLGFEAKVDEFIPTHTDLLIIGDGVLGSSIAHWVKQRAPHASDVIVIGGTKPSMRFESNELSQNFTLPENIQMSQFCGNFLKNLPSVGFIPQGHLHLADSSKAHDLLESYEIRRQSGSRSILLSKNRLAEKFPWLNLNGVELGCLGLEYEGCFDANSLLKSLYNKNMQLGVQYLNANIVGFNFKKIHNTEKCNQIVVELENDTAFGDRLHGIKFAYCIIAADSNLNHLATTAKADQFGQLKIQMPFIPRKRFLHSINTPHSPGLDMPVVTDPNGLHFRRDDFRGFVVHSYEPDFAKIEEDLKHRVPRFDQFALTQTTTGLEEINIIDGNGIIGPHPIYHNLFFACGFDTQHGPAVGRAVMELILDGEFKTIDLSRFAFDRILLDTPVHEKLSLN